MAKKKSRTIDWEGRANNLRKGADWHAAEALKYKEGTERRRHHEAMAAQNRMDMTRKPHFGESPFYSREELATFPEEKRGGKVHVGKARGGKARKRADR